MNIITAVSVIAAAVASFFWTKFIPTTAAERARWKQRRLARAANKENPK